MLAELQDAVAAAEPLAYQAQVRPVARKAPALAIHRLLALLGGRAAEEKPDAAEPLASERQRELPGRQEAAEAERAEASPVGPSQAPAGPSRALERPSREPLASESLGSARCRSSRRRVSALPG